MHFCWLIGFLDFTSLLAVAVVGQKQLLGLLFAALLLLLGMQLGQTLLLLGQSLLLLQKYEIGIF